MRVFKETDRPFRSWAVRVSSVIIIFSLLVSVLGYVICSDKTPHANDGLVEIGKQLPGYRVKVLKIKKNYQVDDDGWLSDVLFGKESDYSVIPIKGYTLNDLILTADVVGKENYYKEFNLIDVVFPVYKAPVSDTTSNYYLEKGDEFVFKDRSLKEVVITRDKLLEKFKTENLDERFFFLGSDIFGRDLYSRLVIGTRVSVFIGFASVILSLVIGLILGTISGYFGGFIDNVVMWLMSVVWSIPGIILVIAVSMVLNSKGIWVTFIAIGLTTWVEAARVIRGQVKALKEMQFVEAAKAYGLRDFSIVFKHIVPNIYSSLIVIATTIYATSILLEAGLSFLGLSVQPPAPSWGNMVYEGYQVLGTKNSWHLILFPGMAIIIMVLSFNLLGIELQKISNPQKQTGNL